MIKINFNKYVTGKNRKIIRQASEFFLTELLSERKAKNTNVVIRFVSLPAKILGFCAIHEDEHNDYHPKMFDIELSNKLTLPEALKILAHEMTHLRQFRNKELGYRYAYTMYRGRAYSLETPYDKSPWEIEAMKAEIKLVEKFNKFIRG